MMYWKKYKYLLPVFGANLLLYLLNFYCNFCQMFSFFVIKFIFVKMNYKNKAGKIETLILLPADLNEFFSSQQFVTYYCISKRW